MDVNEIEVFVKIQKKNLGGGRGGGGGRWGGRVGGYCSFCENSKKKIFFGGGGQGGGRWGGRGRVGGSEWM